MANDILLDAGLFIGEEKGQRSSVTPAARYPGRQPEISTGEKRGCPAAGKRAISSIGVE